VIVIGSGWLERPIELRLSTVLALGMTGMIAVLLLLTYIKLPPAEDATLRNFVALAPDGTGAGASPVLAEPHQPGEAEGISPEAPFDGLTRPLPIWSPRSVSREGTAELAGARSSPARPDVGSPPPEIRNVETVADRPPEAATAGAAAHGSEAAPGVSDGGGASREAREGAGFIHRIQVRAKESMKGAEQIVAYLEKFGFDRSQAVIERDRHGDKNAEGIALYTVFVGAYESREQALPELEKLKEATRESPFQEKATFREMFQDALVVRRRR
jgi:hypothetical protein